MKLCNLCIKIYLPYYASIARELITKLLEREGEISIRQISIKTGSQWRTVEKALETMLNIGIVKERTNKDVERLERLFSLVKK